MLKKWLLLASCTALVSMSGCSWLPSFDWGNDKAFEPAVSTLKYKPYPFALRQEIMAVQQIHVEYFGKHIPDELKVTDFSALLWANNKTLKLSVLTPMHQRLWDIQFNGETIHEERLAPLPETLQAGYLLRDIAAAFWPATNLRAQDKRFDVIDDGLVRQIVNKVTGAPELTVSYSEGAQQQHPWGTIEIINHQERYRLTILSRQAR